jgi:hypothetical protein
LTQIVIRNSRLERSHLTIHVDGGVVRVSVRRSYLLWFDWTVSAFDVAVLTTRHVAEMALTTLLQVDGFSLRVS